jgi:large subunit ribosomal protein L13
MKTYSPRPRDVERRWYVVDAQGVVLGRLASEVAKILRGKHKPIFAPHMDTGDHVIVVNARGIRLTGGKDQSKVYWRHSGYPGGIRGQSYATLLTERPALAVERAVKGMLPKNRLGRAMVRKLNVYEGPEHPHEAQQPVSLNLGEVPSWDGLPAPPPAPAPKPAPKRAAAKAARPARSAAKPRATGAAKAPAKAEASTTAPARGRRSRRSGAEGAEGAEAPAAEAPAAEAPKRSRRTSRASKDKE